MKHEGPERIGDLMGVVPAGSRSGKSGRARDPAATNGQTLAGAFGHWTDDSDAGFPSGRIPLGSRPVREVGEEDLPGLIAVLWPQIVGPEIAANARPLHYRAGRLVISTSSSAWAQTLQLMSEEIAARLDARLGEGRVRRLSFRHAGWDEAKVEEVSVSAVPGPVEAAAPRAPLAPARPLSAPQQEALRAVDDLDLSPDLRTRIQAAMRAMFVREEKDSVR